MHEYKAKQLKGKMLRGKRIKPQVTFHDEIVFDNNTRVLINRVLEEGVYLARDVRNSKQLYALKKVDCQDKEDKVEQCCRESAVHQLFPNHENIMPLVGTTYEQPNVYMLFPYFRRSLEDEISVRRLREDRLESERRPFTSIQVLTIFAGIVRAVHELHCAGMAHRDIRVENVMLKQTKKGRCKHKEDVRVPVLTDFGSVRPLKIVISDVAKAQEDVDQSTTAAYRAPELFALSQHYNSKEHNNLQYGPADVWSLGCLLFAMLYGLSPLEMEWRLSLVEGNGADATIQFVGFSQERLLESTIPFPPDGSSADLRYGDDMKDLIQCMLNEKAEDRPSTSEILTRVERMLSKKE